MNIKWNILPHFALGHPGVAKSAHFINELLQMTEEEIEVAILGKLFSFEDIKPIVEYVERDRYDPSKSIPWGVRFEFRKDVQMIAHRVLRAETKLNAILAEIANEEAGDLFIEGDREDLDIENLSFKDDFIQASDDLYDEWLCEEDDCLVHP